MIKIMISKLSIPILILSFFFVQSSQAQINTEKYRKYLTKEGFIFNAMTTVSIKAGNTEYTAIKGTGRIDYNGKKMDYFLVGNLVYKSATENKIENQGFVHFRGIWNVGERTDLEYFVQQQYDEFIDLNSRSLAGMLIKQRLIQFKSSKDSTNTFDLNLAIGLMYEREQYNLNPDLVETYLWRGANFASFDWLITEKLNLNGVVYYQPAFEDFSDFRVSAEAGFEFAIAKQLYFIFAISYKYNNKPITDVKQFDLSIDNGIRFEIK